MDANNAIPTNRRDEMNKQLKPGLTLDTHVSAQSGETIYTICDAVGVVFTTIFEARLERFYLEAAQ
jgi:hypothetical protein